jgi:hypothetical protein
MDVALLKQCLTQGNREVLGIPFVSAEIASCLSELLEWTTQGKPHEGRQVWFIIANPQDIREGLHAHLRCRILPLSPEQGMAHLKRQPCDSLLLPLHGFQYGDPNVSLPTFWTSRGKYERCEEFHVPGWGLWFWKSNHKPLKLFAMDHHHAVLWDAKQILRPLGIQVDFVWLHDGRPPVNEAIPSTVPSFQSSLDIYKKPFGAPLDPALKEWITKEGYQGVLTSHSLITAYRLQDFHLPQFHINSTRFGNEWINDPEKHRQFVQSIETLLQTNRLRVLHNNEGDKLYFLQYFPTVLPQHHLTIPSLCESAFRLRTKSVSPLKFLVWDTRQVLIKPNESPFMKRLFQACMERNPTLVDSQAILLAQKGHLPEGYLDAYTAVIHIPYNISTMSLFQQVRANIPVWIPSPSLLAQLWADPKEPNELSWTVWSSGSERHASSLDSVRDPKVIQEWIRHCDFYNPALSDCYLQFDSIEDLLEKVSTTNYQEHIDRNEAKQEERRNEIFAAWEAVFKPFRSKL